jgi:hypothetical protein
MREMGRHDRLDLALDPAQPVQELCLLVGDMRYGCVSSLTLTGYESRARIGDFTDAIRLAKATDTTPSVLAERQYRGHAGLRHN